MHFPGYGGHSVGLLLRFPEEMLSLLADMPCLFTIIWMCELIMIGLSVKLGGLLLRLNSCPTDRLWTSYRTTRLFHFCWFCFHVICLNTPRSKMVCGGSVNHLGFTVFGHKKRQKWRIVICKIYKFIVHYSIGSYLFFRFDERDINLTYWEMSKKHKYYVMLLCWR